MKQYPTNYNWKDIPEDSGLANACVENKYVTKDINNSDNPN